MIVCKSLTFASRALLLVVGSVLLMLPLHSVRGKVGMEGRVDELLERLNDLEKSKTRNSNVIKEDGDNPSGAISKDRTQDTPQSLVAVDRIDELLLRLDELETRRSITGSSSAGLDLIKDEEISLPVLTGDDETPEKLEVNYAEILVERSTEEEIISGTLDDISSSPPVVPPSPVNLELRVGELLERLDGLESQASGEKRPVVHPLPLPEDDGGVTEIPEILQSDEIDDSLNGATLGKESSSPFVLPDPPQLNDERLPAPLVPSQQIDVKTSGSMSSQVDVGLRVDELLHRLDSLESAWNRDYSDDRMEDDSDEGADFKVSSDSVSPSLDPLDLAEPERIFKDSREIESLEPPVSKELFEKEPALDGTDRGMDDLQSVPEFDKLGNRMDSLLLRLEALETDKVREKMDSREREVLANQPDKPELRMKTSIMPEKLQAGKKADIKGWDLFVLRELALSNAPDLLVKKARVSALEQGVSPLKFGRYPTVKAKVSYNDYTKIASFQTWDSEPYGMFAYGVESRWVLYNGHKTRRQIKTVRMETLQAQWELHHEEQKVIRQLIDQFFNALDAQIKLRYLKKIDRSIRERLLVYEQKVVSGIDNRMLLNKTMRELENVRSEILNSSHGVEIAKSEMSFLLNADSNFWSKHNLFILPPDFMHAGSMNLEDSVVAKVGQSGVDVAESKYDEIKADMSPVLEFTSNAGYRSKNKVAFDKQGQELNFGLSLSLPITDYFLTKSKLLKAREEVNQAEANKFNLVRKQQTEYESEKLKLELARKNYQLQMELWKLQKIRLEDVRSVSMRGLYDKSSALLEEEELIRRELSKEQAAVARIRHKYLIDLFE